MKDQPFPSFGRWRLPRCFDQALASCTLACDPETSLLDVHSQEPHPENKTLFFGFLLGCSKSVFFLGLNFVTISLDSSHVKNQFLGPSRVVPLWALFSFFSYFLLCPFFVFFSCFFCVIFVIFCSFLHFLIF